MEKEPFTKTEKMWVCPKCRFKVPTSKTTTTQITVDVGEGGDVEIDVKKARRGSMKQAATVTPELLASLPRMSLSEIAQVVYDDWHPVNYAAKPYLEAMSTLNSIKDNYMMDSGSSIVAYFLSNAQSWKGEVAKAVKKELNKRLKSS